MEENFFPKVSEFPPVDLQRAAQDRSEGQSERFVEPNSERVLSWPLQDVRTAKTLYNHFFNVQRHWDFTDVQNL